MRSGGQQFEVWVRKRDLLVYLCGGKGKPEIPEALLASLGVRP